MRKSGVNMGYKIVYHPRVENEDIPTLPETIRERIKQVIDNRLITHPGAYGKPLRTSLSGYRRLRIGDWRLIYRVDGDMVKILIIAHRSKVYQFVFHRLPV